MRQARAVQAGRTRLMGMTLHTRGRVSTEARR
jgi:hypothetical protein